MTEQWKVRIMGGMCIEEFEVKYNSAGFYIAVLCAMTVSSAGVGECILMKSCRCWEAEFMSPPSGLREEAPPDSLSFGH